MLDKYDEFSKRLSSLLHTCDSPVELERIADALDEDDIIEIFGVCPSDPVCERPADVPEKATGPWDRREVQIVVRIVDHSLDSMLLDLIFLTREADDAGDRCAKFKWELDAEGETGLAEMWFNDSKTFKLDYFSVLPPEYACQFVAHCKRAYIETIGAQ